MSCFLEILCMRGGSDITDWCPSKENQPPKSIYSRFSYTRTPLVPYRLAHRNVKHELTKTVRQPVFTVFSSVSTSLLVSSDSCAPLTTGIMQGTVVLIARIPRETTTFDRDVLGPPSLNHDPGISRVSDGGLKRPSPPREKHGPDNHSSSGTWMDEQIDNKAL
jgi:hypothetical protein